MELELPGLLEKQECYCPVVHIALCASGNPQEGGFQQEARLKLKLAREFVKELQEICAALVLKQATAFWPVVLLTWEVLDPLRERPPPNWIGDGFAAPPLLDLSPPYVFAQVACVHPL